MLWMGLALWLGLALSGVASAQVPVQLPDEPTWRWLRTQYSNDMVLTVDDPDRYTIVFREDATVAIRADCNRVRGTYERSGSSLTLVLGAMTRAACPPDSQADIYLRDLSNVATYVMDGEHLVLNLRIDSGNMVFAP